MRGAFILGLVVTFSFGRSIDTYEFPDPIEHYQACGLTKPGRFCDPKTLLGGGERAQANEALRKLSVSVFAFLDISHLFNATDPLNSNFFDINDLHRNISLACQRNPANCAPGPVFVLQFLKMPADAVGGERFDISYTRGPGPVASIDRIEAVFHKALDSAMVDFVQMNLSRGLVTFAQRFSEEYARSGSAGWTGSSFPNPCLSPSQCGLGDRRDAYICDPDSVLKAEQRQKVSAAFQSVGPANRLYVAIGEPIAGDLSIFAKELFANWTIECQNHGRPKPFGLIAVHLSPPGSYGTSLLNSTSVSDGADLNAVVRYVMENEASTASITDRLVEISRRVNESWDGKQWHDVTAPTTSRPHVTTRAEHGNGCGIGMGLGYGMIQLWILFVWLLWGW